MRKAENLWEEHDWAEMMVLLNGGRLPRKIMPEDISRYLEEGGKYAAAVGLVAALAAGCKEAPMPPKAEPAPAAAQACANRKVRGPTDEELIAYHARRVGVDGNLLRAIRRAENGGPGIEFGIIPTPRYESDRGYTDGNGTFREYRSSFEKQLCWCAWTVRRNMERWDRMPAEERETYGNAFIRYLGSRYAPVGAGNDPNGLNENWVRNVSLLSRGRD